MLTIKCKLSQLLSASRKKTEEKYKIQHKAIMIIKEFKRKFESG